MGISHQITSDDLDPAKAGLIRIFRPGEQGHILTLDQIERGEALRYFPEFRRSFNFAASGVSVTGVQRKAEEHRTAVQAAGADFPLFMPPSVLPYTLYDSKEEQTRQSEIVVKKVEAGFRHPVHEQARAMSPKNAAKFLYGIAKRARAGRPEDIILIGDDRANIMNPYLKDPLYGHLKDHPDAQVREIFSKHHKTPGKRTKEVDSANYGVLNAVFRYHLTVQDLNSQGYDFDSRHRLTTTLTFMDFMPGSIEALEEPILFKAYGPLIRYRELTEEDIRDWKNGRIFSYDDLNVVQLEDGTEVTLSELKQRDPLNDYLFRRHSPGAAMTAFLHVSGLHPQSAHKKRKGKNRKKKNTLTRPFPKTHKGPSTVVATGRIISSRPDDREIIRATPMPQGMRLSDANIQIAGSLYRIEQLAASGQAFVVQDPDRFSIPERAVPTGLTKEHIALLRRKEIDLIFSYMATMATVAGAPNHIGRPHMVDYDYWRKYGQWYPRLCNYGLTGDVESEAFRVYRTPDELKDGLDLWDRTTYQHEPQTPRYDYIKYEEALRFLGLKELLYVVAGYGSASSYLRKAMEDPAKFMYELGKLDGVMSVDGGGARSAMLHMTLGLMRARSEGYKLLNLGVRCEDVSPIEGRKIEWFQKHDIKMKEGYDPRHVVSKDGSFHLLELERLMQRQALIASLANSAVFFPGGKGTITESEILSLHNLRVNLFGSGLFPGYPSNERVIPQFFVDHEFNYLGRPDHHVFDRFLNRYSSQELKLMGIRHFSGADAVNDAKKAMLAHAASQGYELRPQTPNRTIVVVKRPSLQVASTGGIDPAP